MIFNRKQVLATLFIAGPLAASLLVAQNIKHAGRKGNVMEIAGFILAMIMYTIAIIIIEHTIARKGLLNDHEGLMNVYAIGIIIVSQLLFGFVLIPFLRKSNSFFPSDPAKTSANAKLIPYLSIGLGLTTLLILFGPFRFFFLLVYMVPHYYIYKRVSMASLNIKTKRLIASLIVMFMLLFPVVEMVYSYYNNALVRIMLQVSYFYLPFILYFFMGLVLYDIIVFMLTELKLIKKSVYSPHPWRNAMITLTGLSLIIVIIANINFNSPSYTTYQLDVEKNNSAMENLQIVVASDFHFAEISSQRFVERFVTKVNALEPDLILLPGDIVESDNNNGKMNALAKEMTNLQARYGVFGSLGNHEYYGNLQKNIEFCEKAGIQMLMDTAIVIDNSFVIAGQNDMHDDNRKSLDQIFAPVDADLPKILMKHRPTEYDAVANHNIQLMVSGHTHHGQLFPFHYMTKAFYDLSWGHLKKGNTHFITTSGAQGWGPQARTTGKSEIAVINIVFR